MDKYLITIGESEYEVTAEQLAGLDLIQTADREYHLLREGKAYHCELVDFKPREKTLSLRLNGRPYELQVGDRYDQMVKQLGLQVATSQASSDVFAPMPGLILDIMVGAGQEIEAGTPLLILEAMKMENVLKADGAGTVKSVVVKQGEAVDKKQLLIEME